MTLLAILAAIGAGFVIVATLVAIGIARASLRDSLDARRARLRREGAEHARRLLAGDARWFSEDEDTMRLLERFATEDVSTVREDWRRRRGALARVAAEERGELEEVRSQAEATRARLEEREANQTARLAKLESATTNMRRYTKAHRHCGRWMLALQGKIQRQRAANRKANEERDAFRERAIAAERALEERASTDEARLRQAEVES